MPAVHVIMFPNKVFSEQVPSEDNQRQKARPVFNYDAYFRICATVSPETVLTCNVSK